MRNGNKNYMKFDHDQYAKTKAADDFWGQIRRTVGGQPVSDDQIDMILEATKLAIQFTAEDKLLDLACGNGALSQALFPYCCEYLGVDLSEYLICVAKQNFERLPSHQFVNMTVREYILKETDPKKFTKVLCYGSFAYFPPDDAQMVLEVLHQKFVNVQRMFFGNLPDRDLASGFYKSKELNETELNDYESQIGIWRNKAEFNALAKQAGWDVTFTKMPISFYASNYRYDALLTRRN